MSMKQKQTALFFVFPLFLFALLTTLDRSSLESINQYGLYSAQLVFVWMAFMLLRRFVQGAPQAISLRWIYLAIFSLGIVFVISYEFSPYMEMYPLIVALCQLLFMLGIVREPWHPGALAIGALLLSVASLFFFVHWLGTGMKFVAFKSIYRNENYLGVLLFSFVYFYGLAIWQTRRWLRVYFFMMLLIVLTLIITTSARSVLIGLLVIVLSLFVAKWKDRLFKRLFYIVLGGNASFIIVYIGLYETRLGDWMNDLSVEIFKKNLFSGRPEIWQHVFSAIQEKPFFGHGIGVQAFDVVDTTLTAHNMYLQILLEFGIVGFSCFLFLLWMVWLALMKRRHAFPVRWAACFMLGILVYNMFELTLFHNNYSIAIFQWLILLSGVNMQRVKDRRSW